MKYKKIILSFNISTNYMKKNKDVGQHDGRPLHAKMDWSIAAQKHLLYLPSIVEANHSWMANYKRDNWSKWTKIPQYCKTNPPLLIASKMTQSGQKYPSATSTPFSLPF